MRFLADENFPGDAVASLRTLGHDVVWIRTEAPGITDQHVLARSLQDGRVLLTSDKDFGELAWRSGLPASCGIVLFRLPALGPTGVGKVIADVLMSCDDWPGHFSVVEPGRVRMRGLPAPPVDEPRYERPYFLSPQFDRAIMTKSLPRYQFFERMFAHPSWTNRP